jgi:hypothetical protein
MIREIRKGTDPADIKDPINALVQEAVKYAKEKRKRVTALQIGTSLLPAWLKGS